VGNRPQTPPPVNAWAALAYDVIQMRTILDYRVINPADTLITIGLVHIYVNLPIKNNTASE